MIEQAHIGGRDALVVYLTLDFQPVDKLAADLVKIIYDDGDVHWMALREQQLEEKADGDTQRTEVRHPHRPRDR